MNHKLNAYVLKFPHTKQFLSGNKDFSDHTINPSPPQLSARAFFLQILMQIKTNKKIY